MAILVPIASRLTGTWSVNGAASAHAALSDGSEASDIQTDEVNTARLVVQMSPGAISQEGDLTYRVRIEHNGNPQDSSEATVNVYQGDPDAGGRLALDLFNDMGIPRNTQTVERTLTRPQQRALGNLDDVWLEVFIGRNDGGVTIYWFELEVPDDPVGTWNFDLSAVPLNTLVWFQMTDGRARQGRRLSNLEYDDGAGNAIELDQHNFPKDADGKREASRAVIAWGAI